MAIDKQAEICEIIIGFMKAKVSFDSAFELWQSGGSFDFSVMDKLETKLYSLKDKTHLALRDSSDENSGWIQKADLFDLIIGSIFHEALHLKEYIYTLRSYAPRYSAFTNRKKGGRVDLYTDDFLKTSMDIVNEAKTNLPRKAYEVKKLFEDGLLLLEDIIKKYRNNSRVIRTLFTLSEIVDRVYGSGGLNLLYSRVYKNGPAEGYLRVGSCFMKDGFHNASLEAFEKAAEILEQGDEKNSLNGELLKKCRQLQKTHPSLQEKAEKLISKISS